MTDDIEHTSLEHFDTIMNTNVRGPFYMTMLAAPHIIHSRGTSRDRLLNTEKLFEINETIELFLNYYLINLSQ